MALGLAGQHRGQVLADQEAGHADVAAEELVRAPGTTRTSDRPSPATSGSITEAPYSPVRTRDGRRPPGREADAIRWPSVRGRPVALGRRAVDPGEEARAGRRCPTRPRPRPPSSISKARAMPMPFSCWGSPRRRRPRGTAGRPAGSTRRRRRRAGGRAPERKTSCQSSTMSTTARRLLDGVGAHGGLGVVAADAQGHDAGGGQLGVLVEDAAQGVVEHGAVVDARADDDLAVHLDAVVEQGPQPAQAGGAPAVAQHARPAARGRWRGCVTLSGLSRSVTTRSRSISVKRVRVVKFP